MKKLWFKNKRYGWGWTPASWQGWAVLAAYLLLVVCLFWITDSFNRPDSDAFFIPFLALTAVLIIICYLTGEKPRWRWGKDD